MTRCSRTIYRACYTANVKATFTKVVNLKTSRHMYLNRIIFTDKYSSVIIKLNRIYTYNLNEISNSIKDVKIRWKFRFDHVYVVTFMKQGGPNLKFRERDTQT